MSSMSESTWTAAVAGRPPNRARHERLLRMFVRIEPGEGRCLLLFFTYAFLVLVSWYIVRTLREPLLLVGASPEVKTYASAAAALALLILVPLYGAAFRRAKRNQLVRWVTGFFVATLGVFYLAASSGADIGFVYYVWVGVLGVTIVAQFWAHAADCFDVETGKRLFPAIMAGATLGGIAGPSIYGALHGLLDTPQLMLVAIVLLAATVPLVAWTRSSVPSSRRGSVAAASVPETNLLGGFSLIARDRYLLLVALLVVLLNCVSTMGEYLLSSLVVSQAELRVATDPSLDKGQLIGEFYASFYLAMNVLTVVLQVFLVGRLFRWIGVNGALLVLPLVALIGYGLVVFVPLFALLRAVKICECAGNYSILNTARQALFLPLSTSGKYEGKIAADTFFWRFGDLIPAVIVFVGLNWLGFEAQQFAIVNIGLSLAWLAVTWKLARHSPERVEPPAPRPPAAGVRFAYAHRPPTLALVSRASGWVAVAVGFIALAASAPADAAGEGAMASEWSSTLTCCLHRRVEVVGPVGLEPTTKGFTSPAVSGGSGLSLHPPTSYRVGCGTLAPVIKSTAALR